MVIIHHASIICHFISTKTWITFYHLLFKRYVLSLSELLLLLFWCSCCLGVVSSGQCSFVRWEPFAMISENWHLHSEKQPGHIARGSDTLYLKANLFGLKYCGLASSTAQQLRLCELLFLGWMAESLNTPCYAACPTVRGAERNSNNLCSVMEWVLQRPQNSCNCAILRTASSISRSGWASKPCLSTAIFTVIQIH